MKAPVQNQGTVIVESAGVSGWYVMFPDGVISWQRSKAKAEAAAKKWFEKNVDAKSIGVGEIEWRP